MGHLKLALATLLAFTLLPPFSALAQTRDAENRTQASADHQGEATWAIANKPANSPAALANSTDDMDNDKPTRAIVRRSQSRAQAVDGTKLAISAIAFTAGATLETIGIALAWHQCSVENRCESRHESSIAAPPQRKAHQRVASKQ